MFDQKVGACEGLFEDMTEGASIGTRQVFFYAFENDASSFDAHSDVEGDSDNRNKSQLRFSDHHEAFFLRRQRLRRERPSVLQCFVDEGFSVVDMPADCPFIAEGALPLEQ